MSITSAVHAAVYVPTKPADTADGACDADCSLREAVLAANTHPGDDVILLHKGVYVLSIPGDEALGAAGDLDVLDDLVLIGDGAGNTTVNGGAVDRIFQIPGGITVEIRDVTLRNGRAQGDGGAILNMGELTVVRSLLAANASVAGASGEGYGGAIFTDGQGSSLVLTGSVLSGNTAQAGGGGIAIGGQAALANVTIAGNQTTGPLGGGIYVFARARTQVNNATIVGNSATLEGGGIFAANAAFIGFNPSVFNSILAGNIAASKPDCSGSLDSGYDLISDATGCIGPSAARHDLLGTPAARIDPRTGLLAFNGGPTPTTALLAGSPALNAGNPAAPGGGALACEAVDQRGVARPAGGCDIGAFEATTACVAGGPTLCLNNGRFKVTATWQTRTENGTAQGETLTGESGYFWFFDPGNVELTVKILNGCARNGHYWFFASGLTDVRVDLTVMDTKTGATKTYTNPRGQAFRPIQDTRALNTCP